MNEKRSGDERMDKKIAAHLRPIGLILADEDAATDTMTGRAVERLPSAEFRVLAEGEDPSEAAAGCSGPVLYYKRYKGAFLRFCPGTRRYHCCGYRIAHIGENCPLDCSYCILKAYFQDNLLKVWSNSEDLFAEVEAAAASNPALRYRIGTGEFTDSLALEPLTGYARDLAEFLRPFDNVVLELKTKLVELSWLDAARPDRVLPAWSVNAPEVWKRQEIGAQPMEARLQAARTCAEAGFRVCLHFDPIIRYPGWQKGYAEVVEMIHDYLKPSDIAYISLGSFRFMPPLKRSILERRPDATYVFEEYAPGLDGKMRLIRPLRVEQFRFIADALRKGGLDEQLYFCMESSEVWRAVLGRTPTELGGLDEHLMRRAFDE